MSFNIEKAKTSDIDLEESKTVEKKAFGMKNLHWFFLCIFILPLTIGIVVVTLVEAYMIQSYFRLVIETLSDQVKIQTLTVKDEILIANKYYIMSVLNERFVQAASLKSLVNDMRMQNAANDPNNLFGKVKARVFNKSIECLTTNKTDYKSFPLCIDMFDARDQKESSEPYRIMLANAFTIFNGNMNALGNFNTTMNAWQNDNKYINDLVILISLSPVLTALTENLPNETYSADRRKSDFTEVITPEGLYGINYFNFDFINTQDMNPQSDCPSAIKSLYPSAKTKLDPRCLPWYTNVLDFMCIYRNALASQTNNPSLTLNEDNMLYSTVVWPVPMKNATDDMRVKISVITNYSNTACNVATKDTFDPSAFVISKDVYFFPFLDMVSSGLSRIIATYLRYSPLTQSAIDLHINRLNAIVSKKVPSNSNDPKTMLEWLRLVKNETNFAMGFFVLYMKSDLTYSVLADMRLNQFFNDGFKAPATNPTVQDLQLEKDIIFIKNLIKDKNIKIQASLAEPLKFAELKGDIVNYELYNKDSKKFETKQVYYTIESIGGIDQQRDNFVEYLKIVYIMPHYLITERYTQLVDGMDKKVFMNSVYASLIVLLLLISGIVIILLFASKVVRHLNEAVLIAKQVLRAEPVTQNKDESDKNLNYEILETKKALYDLNKVFNSSKAAGTSAESGDGEDKNVLTYAYKIRLFTMLDDKPMCGVLTNNLGNIHFNAGRYEEAFSKYQESLDILDAMNDMNRNMSEDDYVITKTNRQMNQCIALKQHIEEDLRRNEGIYKTDTFQRIEKMKKIISSIKDRAPDASHDKHIRCSCWMAWISRIREENFGAQSNLDQATERFKKFKDKLSEHSAFILAQEIDYERASLLFKDKKYKKALELATDALKRDKYFEMSFRKKYVALIINLFKKLGQPLTPSLKELQERYLERPHNKKYILALDYSASMRNESKITNCINTMLEIWDNYIKPFDKVAYVRFNLNPDVVFGLESKGVNTFAKRVEIEKSVYPRDRTCIFDCIIKCCDLLKRDSKGQGPTDNLIILFCDGDDTSSLKQEREAIEAVQASNCCLVCIGLGLSLKDETRGMMTRLAQASSHRGGVYLDIKDQSFKDLFQVLSQYANNVPYTEIKWE